MIKGCDPTKCRAYGPGLEKGIAGIVNTFTVETKGAGVGGLGLSVEGPAEAQMNCIDNRDGSCTVEYIPNEPGEYDVGIKFADQNIPGDFYVLTFMRRFLLFLVLWLKCASSLLFAMLRLCIFRQYFA